ncbi:MAG: bifunctional adenosylcobinamide kinase/adenosylcobinamide-phosphate guanylyltransferase [Eubacteriales bacterium]|nr:bifunctional adenosylcobinamide kinase/adenosylcobinamide-phosphate guanylyltransferase [Eubacteriales bacterium]
MILVLGGGASGKSEYAEELTLSLGFEHNYYIAAMEIDGEEAASRVARHKSSRKDKGFITIEQPRDVSKAVSQMVKPSESAAILECISNLTANEMFGSEPPGCDEVSEKVIADVLELDAALGGLIVVSNNVFEDGVTYDEITENYIKCMADINLRLSKKADAIYEVVLGIPLRL